MDLKLRKYNYLILAGLALLPLQGSAQVHAPVLRANNRPALSTEQFVQGHYAVSAISAKEHIDSKQQRPALRNPVDADQVRYNKAVSELKNNAPGAADHAKEAMQETPDPAHYERMAFNLAHHYFKDDHFADAIKFYEDGGVFNLDNDEVADQKFELAYSYFNNKQFDKAKPLFSAIKDIQEHKYYRAGNYYYGLLAYNENRYDEALKSFDIVKDDPEYRAVVPYYIAEIWYFKGNKEKALTMADTLIHKKEKSYYDKELHLLAAQCLFEQQKYTEAKPYFDYYYQHADKIRKEDLYEIAYCDYRLDQWKSAMEKFKMLSDTRDSLGQTSMYLLGDCYLKTGNKAGARNAFGICADMSFNKGLQEAAMILYARLSYETGNHDEALRQLKGLLEAFPSSKYRDEAQTMISGLLLKTNKYDEALDRLQQVKVKDNNYKAVYQKATYGYGVQLYRNGEYRKADEYFGMSVTNPINSEYERAAYFWRGEAAFHNKKYEDAINYHQNFISRMGDIATVEHLSPQATIQHGYITMGYAAMETGNYVAAQDYFNQAQLAKTADKRSSAAALLLEADAVFMQKNFAKAIALYDKVIAAGGQDADYAKFQKAILLGLQGKSSEKIALLQTLTKAKPASLYAGNAQYEIALTYLETDKYKDALAALKPLTEDGKDMSLGAKAWMKTGFVYQQLGDNNKAIEAYRKVVINYAGAEERFAALEALKSLYIQVNKPEAYSQLLKESNLPGDDKGAMDSTYYSAAEAQFEAEKWDDSRQAFVNYLASYPNGVFAVKAHYYLGESYQKLKRNDEALKEYNAVLATTWNDFSEVSGRRAAGIAMDSKDYENAYRYYTILLNNSSDGHATEGIYRGLMKAGYHIGKYEEAGKYADSLMNISTVSPDAVNEAQFYKAHILQQNGKDEDAITAYKALAGNKNGDVAAESRYRVAEILLKQDKLKEAEEAANETIKQSGGYDNWVGKAYILLSDILLKQKDYFNAKALLQSIVKNTKIAELKQEATRKLEEVKKAEKNQSKLED